MKVPVLDWKAPPLPRPTKTRERRKSTLLVVLDEASFGLNIYQLWVRSLSYGSPRFRWGGESFDVRRDNEDIVCWSEVKYTEVEG